MNRCVVLWLACVLSIGAGGLARGDEPIPQVEIGGGGDVPSEDACFNARQMRTFTALSDRHLYLEGPRNEHYLLSVFGTCIGLRDAINIRITSDFVRVCSDSDASVSYRGMPGPGTCRVQRVEAVDDKESAELLARFRARSE